MVVPHSVGRGSPPPARQAAHESTEAQKATETFAEDIRLKAVAGPGQLSEDDLRNPFEKLFRHLAELAGCPVALAGERPVGELGRPDFHVSHAGRPHEASIGCVELKRLGKGVDPRRFKKGTHEARQWDRFRALDNILYFDGDGIQLFRYGQPVGNPVVLTAAGRDLPEGATAVVQAAGSLLLSLLREFLTWKPVLATTADGTIKLDAFAMQLAPLCRMLRDAVVDALPTVTSAGARSHEPLRELHTAWQETLLPDASPEQFADAYAQTVTFALLLARTSGLTPLTYQDAPGALRQEHSLLSEALTVATTSPDVRMKLEAPLGALLRLIGKIPSKQLSSASGANPTSHWLLFYEQFLSEYDETFRKKAGVYYTPVPVAEAQVRLVQDALISRLGKSAGFTDDGVITLDPALGTGTYLLRVIDCAADHILRTQGAGAVRSHLTTLAANLRGIEIMIGPHAISELRLTDELTRRGAQLPTDGLCTYVADTLHSPNREPPIAPLFSSYLPSISRHGRQVRRLKGAETVVVCLGNPPWGRTAAEPSPGWDSKGSWVRWGDRMAGGPPDPEGAILDDFIQPVLAAGRGRDAKNLYDLYIYFWRWALWKTFGETRGLAQIDVGDDTFEQNLGEVDAAISGANRPVKGGPSRAGVVSFVTNSKWLTGSGFGGMRKFIRAVCDEVFVIDLGGGGRSARKDENVFKGIMTACAIVVAIRTPETDRSCPAIVKYRQLTGDRTEKLAELAKINGLESGGWELCTGTGMDNFTPSQSGEYESWPRLTELLPWQITGIEFKRKWPIAPVREMIADRWKHLLALTGDERSVAFLETGARKASSLGNHEPQPPTMRYSYRSFDRQWAISDKRVCDGPKEKLRMAHSAQQLYLTTLTTEPLERGPALTVAAHIPDRHHFCGRGGKDVFPLWRDSDAVEPNLLPGLLELLGKEYGRDALRSAGQAQLGSVDVYAYVYAVAANPEFTRAFYDNFDDSGPRIPLTKELNLFHRARRLGLRLLHLHTFGDRIASLGLQRRTLRHKIMNTVEVDSTGLPGEVGYDADAQVLVVGNGRFEPVSPEIWEFKVSGWPVVERWVEHRMSDVHGRHRSALDEVRPGGWTSEMTTDLLALLNAIDQTVICYYPIQERLFCAITDSRCFTSEEFHINGVLPPPASHTRAAGSRGSSQQQTLVSPS